MIVDPSLPAEERLERQQRIIDALLNRVERANEIGTSAYALFQTAIALEGEVKERTRDLQSALDDLGETSTRLETANSETERARQYLANALDALREGLALFADGRLVICNRQFLAALPDIASRIRPGLAFEEYVRIVSHSEELELPEGQTPEDWARFRLSKHGSALTTFTIALKGDRWVQISDRKTPNNGAAILHTDITDMVRQQRIERERVLDDQARLARATFEHLSQGICTFDANGNLAGCNTKFREFLNLPFDLSREGVNFTRILDYLKRNEILTSRRTVTDLERWVQSRQRPPISLEMQRIDGMVLDVNLQALPDNGYVASFANITAERQAIEAMHRINETLEQRVAERTAELTEANKALIRRSEERRRVEQDLRIAKEEAEAANISKTRFLAAASHDLLQPLNAAKLFVSTLSETATEGPQAEITTRLSRAFNSVEAILHSLLDISRLDAGGAEFAVSSFPICTILDPLREDFSAIAAEKGLKFRVAPTRLRVRSDPAYFRRIVQNLASNAVKYTQSGTVLVGCRRCGDKVSLQVWDTGPGISPDDQTRIFEEFQRLGGGSGEEGMGLGLSIVDRACRQLGHRLSLRSEPGRGSVFSVVLDAAPGLHGEPLPPMEPEDTEQSDLDLIAAVVENDAEVLFATTTMLESWGVGVLPAASTQKALENAAELGLPPDIIIADFHLDDGDTGLSTIKALRQMTGVAIPAVLVTADRSEEVRAEAEAMGVVILPKPVEPQKLRALIDGRNRWPLGSMPGDMSRFTPGASPRTARTTPRTAPRTTNV